MREFEKIYNTYFKDVFFYIRRLSNNEHIAEEITSETFYRAMRSIDNFRGDCDIRVWLCQIAKNCYCTYLQRAKQVDSIEDVDILNLLAEDENTEEKLYRKDKAIQIHKILHDIPEPYKEVFMWRVFGELSYKQIGSIFHKSENWACVTYHRARNMMKERLEGMEQ